VSSLDAELRAFAGGYYFNNSAEGSEEISGPRARTELRLYDLAMLGEGSRLTLEGLIQHDNLRGTQTEVGLYVRVPFGPSPGCRLSRIQRRMVDRIVRDVDVVASNQAIDDPANFASTGVAIDSVRVVDANDDLSVEVAAAGEDSVVVVDGSAGIISEGDTTVLSSGQVVIGGGGSTLNVVGRNTGAQVQFSTPGTRPQVNGTAAGTDVFQIANDSTLTGLDITGGNDGVFGDSVTGFTLRDLNISGAAEDGVFLDGTNSGDIRNVVSNLNGDDGFFVNNFNGGTFSSNTAIGNGFGFFVDDFNGGTISGNTASGNDSGGFFVGTFAGGTISGNTASDNNDDGFRVINFTVGNSVVFSNNSSTNNTSQGYDVTIGTPFDGVMTNTGTGNGGGNDNF
jgi:parallel beta-helix repeat protein